MPVTVPGSRPNVLFILADQLRAASLPMYGESQIATPHLDRLAREGMRLDNTISSCPVCTPYRAMLLTGRHPQTTGHVFNHVVTRHDEISVADAFGRDGYRTGWVGKWHLHTAGWGALSQPDYVPEGRDRLGFDYWRAYNCHMTYFDGFIAKEDWRLEPWKGYETVGLLKYVNEFIETPSPKPFCLFLSPHQPHWTPFEFAPKEYYDRLPAELTLPANVPDSSREEALKAYRHYLAMTLALDDMVGTILDYLDRTGLADNTILVFTSDHGSQMGAQGIHPWEKQMPYEETIRVPGIVRWPGHIAPGPKDVLTAPVDFFPTLAGLCGVPIPSTVEGLDLSRAWLGEPGAPEPDGVFTMNFVAGWPGYLQDGNEWRGVRTKTHSYARWLDGRSVLFDLVADPLETNNLASSPAASPLRDSLESLLQSFMRARGDELIPCTQYASWFDPHRRVIRNAFGPLPHPESLPRFPEK